MNLKLIKTLSEKTRIPVTELAGKIGMSVQNLHRCIRINQIQAHQLEIIAQILGAPIQDFFYEKASSTYSKNETDILIEKQKLEIQMLREMLHDKNQIIALLQKNAAQADDTATCVAVGGI